MRCRNQSTDHHWASIVIKATEVNTRKVNQIHISKLSSCTVENNIKYSSCPQHSTWFIYLFILAFSEVRAVRCKTHPCIKTVTRLMCLLQMSSKKTEWPDHSLWAIVTVSCTEEDQGHMWKIIWVMTEKKSQNSNIFFTYGPNPLPYSSSIQCREKIILWGGEVWSTLWHCCAT